MKRKTATALCMAACMGLLPGCGQKETMGALEEAVEAMATAEDSGNLSDSRDMAVESETEQSSGTATTTVSRYLGEGRKILYRIDELDKGRSPEYIYFFEDGKVTCLEQSDLNLTMGELSKITDEAIWEKMEECCAAKYDSLSDLLHQLEENKLKAGIVYMELNKDQLDTDSFAKEMLIQMYMRGTTAIELPAYSTADDSLPEYWEEWADTFPGGQEEIAKTGEEICAQMESYMPEMKGLGENIPTAFILQTDATGNNVVAELVVWMDVDGNMIKRIVMLGKKMTGKIYDSDYACYVTDDGDMICVRDETEIIFDETDNVDVLVDVPVDTPHMKEIFE